MSAAVTEWLTIAEAAELLGVSKGRVSRLLEEHHLIAKRIDRELKIPAALIVDGAPLASLRGTVILLTDCGLASDAIFEWLFTDATELGESPVSALLAGKKAPVRRLAQMLAV